MRKVFITELKSSLASQICTRFCEQFGGVVYTLQSDSDLKLNYN